MEGTALLDAKEHTMQDAGLEAKAFGFFQAAKGSKWKGMANALAHLFQSPTSRPLAHIDGDNVHLARRPSLCRQKPLCTCQNAGAGETCAELVLLIHRHYLTRVLLEVAFFHWLRIEHCTGLGGVRLSTSRLGIIDFVRELALNSHLFE